METEEAEESPEREVELSSIISLQGDGNFQINCKKKNAPNESDFHRSFPRKGMETEEAEESPEREVELSSIISLQGDGNVNPAVAT